MVLAEVAKKNGDVGEEGKRIGGVGGGGKRICNLKYKNLNKIL